MNTQFPQVIDNADKYTRSADLFPEGGSQYYFGRGNSARRFLATLALCADD
jgi:hypothetical protein